MRELRSYLVYSLLMCTAVSGQTFEQYMDEVNSRGIGKVVQITRGKVDMPTTVQEEKDTPVVEETVPVVVEKTVVVEKIIEKTVGSAVDNSKHVQTGDITAENVTFDQRVKNDIQQDIQQDITQQIEQKVHNDVTQKIQNSTTVNKTEMVLDVGKLNSLGDKLDEVLDEVKRIPLPDETGYKEAVESAAWSEANSRTYADDSKKYAQDSNSSADSARIEKIAAEAVRKATEKLRDEVKELRVLTEKLRDDANSSRIAAQSSRNDANSSAVYAKSIQDELNGLSVQVGEVDYGVAAEVSYTNGILAMKLPKGRPFTYDMFTQQQLAVITGPKGDTGVGIASTAVNSSGHLIVTMDDNSTRDAGMVMGKVLEEVHIGDNGHVFARYKETLMEAASDVDLGSGTVIVNGSGVKAKEFKVDGNKITVMWEGSSFGMNSWTLTENQVRKLDSIQLDKDGLYWMSGAGGTGTRNSIGSEISGVEWTGELHGATYTGYKAITCRYIGSMKYCYGRTKVNAGEEVTTEGIPAGWQVVEGSIMNATMIHCTDTGIGVKMFFSSDKAVITPHGGTNGTDWCSVNWSVITP